jgi:hypothetical protein
MAHPPAEQEALFSRGNRPTTAKQVGEALLTAEHTALADIGRKSLSGSA